MSEERIVTSFNPEQIQDFNSVVEMSVYICLAVVTLLTPAANSAKCVKPDQYELTMQQYYKNVYYNISSDNLRRMVAVTVYSLDENKNPIASERIVFDYNVMIQFVIPVNGGCKMSKLNYSIVREIPDYATKLDGFPLKLPDDLPKGITFWNFFWPDGDSVILGVLDITGGVCPVVVYGQFNGVILNKELVAYIRGNYSLNIQNMGVFEVPSKCLKEMPRADLKILV